MADERIIVNRTDGGLFAPLWLGGWLFTLGYLHLHLVKAIFAIAIWPYYLGAFFARP
jgi:hypothetical protein